MPKPVALKDLPTPELRELLAAALKARVRTGPHRGSMFAWAILEARDIRRILRERGHD